MRITAITRDLMDRSKITGAFGEVTVLRSVDGLAESEPDVVLVDLGIDGAVDAAVATGAQVIGFGSHVDEEALACAGTLGAKAMARSVFFRQLANGTLLA